MKNSEVADVLDRLGELVEASGDDRFKVIAYHRAATSVRNLEEDVEKAWREGRLQEIKYVGEGISRKIDEYLRTGSLRLLKDLEARVPQGAPDLMKVQGVGPRTAYRLSHDLGIASVAALKEALDAGRLDTEFGPATVASLREGVERAQSFGRRMLLPEAEGRFEALRAYFRGLGISVVLAGSLRRGSGTVGDLDVLSTDPGALDALAGCPGVEEVLEKGERMVRARLEGGVQVDLRRFSEEELGAAEVYFTGSKAHNIALRTLASGKGWKLNEYGLFDGAGARLAGASEEEVYEKLGLAPVPPELREDRGEVEAASAGKLPRLVRADQVRGDLQMHSTWSDGAAELRVMAAAAKERGYEYMAVTDHSVSVRVANGLTEERFRRQWKEIDALNDELKPFRILKGVEAEIRADGNLDFGREFLDQFDVVGASLHQNFRQDAAKLTARALAALEHPSVDFLCHPTNRLLGRRDPNPLDMEALIRAARDGGKLLEIDGAPQRLDMDEGWARRAVEEGVRVLIDSDAHSVGELDNVAYGVLVARRAWVEARSVANADGLGTLLRAFS